MNRGSGRLDTCGATCVAASAAFLAARIAGSFFPASSMSAASDVGAQASCCISVGMDFADGFSGCSCAKAMPPKTIERNITQRLRIRAAQQNRAAVFFLDIERILYY